MNISKQNIDELNLVLTLNIEKADYETKVDKVLKDYRKKANVPGFRAGKIPMGMMQKMYGKHVLAEQVNQIISEELSKFMQESELQVLGEPMPSENQEPLDFDNQEEFTFSFDIGVAPKVEVNLSKKDKLPYYTIELAENELNTKIEELAMNQGSYEPVEQASEKAIIKGDVVQLDQDGNVFEGGIEVESMEVTPTQIQEKAFESVKVGDVVVFNPKTAFESARTIAYKFNVAHDEAEQIDSNFQFTVTEITTLVPAPINQELFDKTFGKDEVKSEEEFVAKIKEDAAKMSALESDYKFQRDVKEKLVSKVEIPLPEAFLKRWLVYINADKEGITPELIEENMPKHLDELRWQLIQTEIAKANDIKIEKEDALAEAKKVAKMQFMQYGMTNATDEMLDGYANSLLGGEEGSRFFNMALETKVIASVKESVKIEDKSITREEFMKLFDEN